MKISQKIIFGVLLLAHALLAITSMLNNSYTDNEPIYIFQGYSYLVKGETFQSGHPILTGVISAIPLTLIDVDFPPYGEIYHAQRYARNEFLYYGENDSDRIVFLSRLPFVLLSILFAIYVFKWANELYGINAGLFALFVYALNPDILANATLVMTDLPVAGFMFICLYYYWKLNSSEEKKTRNLVLSGLFLGLALSTKSISLFLIPLLLVLPLFFKQKIGSLLKNFSLIFLIAVFVFALINIRDISPIYANDNPFYQVGQSKEFRSEDRLDLLVSSITTNEEIGKLMKTALTKMPMPGSNSVQAYLVQILHSGIGHPQYFLGEYSLHGVWYYYFVVYLIKTPIALLMFFLISLMLFKRIKHKQWHNEYYLLSIIVFILFMVSFVMKLNLGLRHVLLVHLAAFVFLSKIILYINKNKIKRYLFMALVGWYIIASLLIYPFYLSYFNELIGDPDNGHKYIVDSSLDLGQDLKRLGLYLEENKLNDVKLKYAGFEKPSYRGIEYQNLTCKPATGNIIISVSALEGVLYHEGKNVPDLGCYSWLRKLEPIDKVGYSIFIYNVTEYDLNV